MKYEKRFWFKRSADSFVKYLQTTGVWNVQIESPYYGIGWVVTWESSEILKK